MKSVNETYPIWMIEVAFGRDAVENVIGLPKDVDGFQQHIGMDVIRKIAALSTHRFYTDGKWVWAGPAPEHAARPIPIMEALETIGVEPLFEAVDKVAGKIE